MAEPIFGATRGPFNETKARKRDRTLAVAAMSIICAMPADEHERFRKLYRKVFWRGPSLEAGGQHAD